MSSSGIQLAAVSDTPSDPTRELIREKILRWLRNEAGLQVSAIEDDAPLWEIGLDSLGIASIAAELEQETGKRLNLERLYDLQTIRELADHLDRLQPVTGAKAAGTAAGLACTAATVSALANGEDPLEYFESMNRRVRALKEQGLYFFGTELESHDGAWVVAEGRRMLMLGSYAYLGLLEHPHLKQAAASAIDSFGTGHHGARLLTGTTSIHRRLERQLAEFMQAEDAIVFGSGYVTNLATISALIDADGVVICDQWNHASIVDGCRLSGAETLFFRHNDVDSLAEKLQQAGSRRKLVIVDAVFSMDGDICDLPAVCELSKKHRALLMVDEAHSVGVLGRSGRGIQEHFGMGPEDVDVKMGTLSKALGGCGGFVAGRDELTTYLRHHARGYIFSGALPALQASVASAALEVLEREPERLERLWDNARFYTAGLQELGFDTACTATPIVPVMTHTDEITLEMTQRCRAAGVLVVPVCFPAVPRDAPRLRTCVSAAHSREDLQLALDVLARAGRESGLIA